MKLSPAPPLPLLVARLLGEALVQVGLDRRNLLMVRDGRVLLSETPAIDPWVGPVLVPNSAKPRSPASGL